MVDGRALLDLDYSEDSTAEVDANVVMTGDGGLVEVQATAERTPLSRAHLDELLALAAAGIEQLRAAQEQAIARPRRPPRERSAGAAREAAAGHAQRAQAARVRAPAAGAAPGGERWTLRVAARRRWTLPPEDGETFAENALGKARAAAAATGRPSIADDSGIEAAALGGAPGVRSARYAGEDATDEQNLDKLLREAPAGSALEYVCAIAYVDPARGVERLFEGRCAGGWPRAPRGERGLRL